MAVDEKHWLPNRDNLTQQIQMELSQKQKTFSEFFFSFWISILNFRHLGTEYDPHSSYIFGNTGSENYG